MLPHRVLIRTWALYMRTCSRQCSRDVADTGTDMGIAGLVHCLATEGVLKKGLEVMRESRVFET